MKASWVEVNCSLIHIILSKCCDVGWAHQVILPSIRLLSRARARGSLKSLLLLRKQLSLLLLLKKQPYIVSLGLNLLELDGISRGEVHEWNFNLVLTMLAIGRC